MLPSDVQFKILPPLAASIQARTAPNRGSASLDRAIRALAQGPSEFQVETDKTASGTTGKRPAWGRAGNW